MALSTKEQIIVKTKTKIVVLVHYPSIKKENQSPKGGISEEKIKPRSSRGSTTPTPFATLIVSACQRYKFQFADGFRYMNLTRAGHRAVIRGVAACQPGCFACDLRAMVGVR